MDFDMTTAIALSDLPSHWPTRDGRKLHKAIGYRWATRGVRGLTLRTITLPGIGRATCRPWLDEFVRQLNQLDAEPQVQGRPRKRGIAGVEAAAARRRATDDRLARHGLVRGQG